MRTGIAISAVLIVAATWGVAISNIRKPLSAIATSHAGEADNGLDESRITVRPIAYPVLETASVQSAQALLSFSSEHGMLKVRSIGPDITIADALHFSSLLNPRTLGQMLSTQPVAGVGTVAWQRSLYNSPAVFQLVATASAVSVSDSTGKRLLRLQSPPPDYTVSVDQHNRAKLIDKAGTVLWNGTVDKGTAGFSLAGTKGHLNLDFGTIHLVLDPVELRLSTAGAKSWTGPAHGSTTIVALKTPVMSRMLGIRVGGGEPAILSWTPGLRMRTTITIQHGKVTVAGGRVSGTHPVDIGSMSTAIASADTPGRPLVVGSGPLVTPIPPLYVDGAVVDAKYSTSRGKVVAEETVRYQRRPNLKPASALVTRSLRWTSPAPHSTTNTSTTAITYPAPTSPVSTIWAW